LISNTKIVITVLIIQALFLISVCLDLIGMHIPLLRFLLGFISLTFLPGALLLGILGANINRWEDVLYSIAASLGLIMLFGLLLNLIYQGFPNIMPKPLTQLILIPTITGLVIFLSLIFWRLNKQPLLPSCNLVNEMFAPLPLFMTLLPLLGTLGALLIRWYSNNKLILFLFVLIAIIPLLLVWKRVNERYYPLVVLCTSLALLLQNTLAVALLGIRGDTEVEYYAANLALSHGYWNPSFMLEKYAMLRVTLLHVIYSVMTGLDLMSEFKIVHPLLFSTIAVALYKIYSRYFSPRTAALSTFLFVFSFPFFTELARDTRTGLAFLFVAVFILLLLDSKIDTFVRSVLSIIIMFSLVVSHYGTAYFFMFMLLGTYLLTYLNNLFWHRNEIQQHALTLTSIILFITLLYAWYIYTASSCIFSTLITSSIRTAITVITDFFNPSSDAIWALTRPISSFTYKFIRIQFIIVTLLSVIGILIALANHPVLKSILQSRMKKTSSLISMPVHINQEYLYFSILAALLTLLILFISKSMGNRTWMFSMLFLAPYTILGIQFLQRVFGNKSDSHLSMKLFSIFLAMTLLVNSGFIATIIHERSPQPNIDRERIMSQGTEEELFHLFYDYTIESDIQAAYWIFLHKAVQTEIYSSGPWNWYPSFFFYTKYDSDLPPGPYKVINLSSINKEEGYIYLSKKILKLSKIIPVARPLPSYPYVHFVNLSELHLDNYQKIYDDGALIYLKER